LPCKIFTGKSDFRAHPDKERHRPISQPENASSENTQLERNLPYRDDDRIVIWKWINENCLDKERDEISKAVNDRFFAGEAKQEWLDDILSGRNTPFQKETKRLWKAKRKKEKAIQEAMSTVTRMAKQSSKNQL
jgi:hypothetical protein